MYDCLSNFKVLEEEVLHVTVYDSTMEQNTYPILILHPPAQCVTLTSVRLGHFFCLAREEFCVTMLWSGSSLRVMNSSFRHAVGPLDRDSLDGKLYMLYL